MQKPAIQEKDAPRPSRPPEVPFGSNDVRLSPREWVIALGFTAAMMWLIPLTWDRLEPLEPGPDYRIPYRLGYDYRTFERYCASACSEATVLVVGDSVVWGHYVGTDQTLSHYLGELAGGRRFANLGVDGIHPAALAGLVEHFGGSISGKHVIVNCNLLWTSSKRHDLQGKKEFAFNHPGLVPQILPRLAPEAIRRLLPEIPRDIPCYKASGDERLGVVAERTIPFLRWTRHVRVAYFDDLDIPTWTLEHPYASPVAAITLELPSPDEPPSPQPVARPWAEKNIARFNPPWVELETSLQWHYFRRVIDVLRRRGNRVFVLLGPFNEHMLTKESLAVYHQRQREVQTWFRENAIPHAVPPALPSNYYADASHPLAEGYRMLAAQLLAEESFVSFLGGR